MSMKECNHNFIVKEREKNKFFGTDCLIQCKKCKKEITIFEFDDKIELHHEEELLKNRYKAIEATEIKAHEAKIKFDIEFDYSQKRKEKVKEMINAFEDGVRVLLAHIISFIIKGVDLALLVLFILFLIDLIK